MTFEAGLSRLSLSLAAKEILIQRVYRRAMACVDEAYAARAPWARGDPPKPIQRGER